MDGGPPAVPVTGLDWIVLLRALHVIAVTVWFGGGLFAVSMVLPAVRAAGPAGKGFMMAVLRRGGFGKMFGVAATVGVLAGLILFWKMGYHSDPFGTRPGIFLTLGAILGILAFAESLAVSMPNEMRMRKLAAQIGPGGPTPEQASSMEKMAMKQGRAGLRAVVLVGSALVLMLVRNAF